MLLMVHIVDSEYVYLVVKFWIATWLKAFCSLVGEYRLFRGTYGAHLQSRRDGHSPPTEIYLLKPIGYYKYSSCGT